MLEKLFKKYDESRKDMLINGWENLEKFKAEINELLEKCFEIYGFEETKRKYQEYVRNYDLEVK